MSFYGNRLSNPKRKNAFRVIVRDGDNDILLPFSVASADQPKMSVGEARVNFLNHTFKYPGNVSWEDVSITFYESVGNGEEGSTILSALNGIFKNSGYYLPTSMNAPGDQAWRTVSKKDSVSALKQVIIQQLETGNSPVVVDAWKLQNAWVKSISPDQLDYAGEEVMKVSVTFAYDFAEHAIGGQFNS